MDSGNAARDKFIAMARGTGLWMSRVPSRERDAFKAMAKKSFEDDYGMCLKWLFNYYEALLPPPQTQLTSALDELNYRIEALEAKLRAPEASEENVIRTGDGRVIEKKR